MKIRTILGDIKAEELGKCDFHDHLIRSYGPEVMAADHYLQDDVEAACMEVDDYILAGGRSMVCMDPIGCGRDVPKMLNIARKYKGRFHIIMCTGFHKGSNYDNRGHWSMLYPVEKSAELIAKEVIDGMDRYSYAGPIVERTSARAGIIKAGASNQKITGIEQRMFEIVARAQQMCGAAISVHTDMGTMGIEIIDLLKKYGADPEKIVLCHTNKVNDRFYYQSMLDKGVTLAFEGADRPMWGSDLQLAENIKWLIEKGYGGQITLAMDAGRSDWQKGYMAKKGVMAKGISYLLTDFVPTMKKIGISEENITDLLEKNPARVLGM